MIPHLLCFRFIRNFCNQYNFKIRIIICYQYSVPQFHEIQGLYQTEEERKTHQKKKNQQHQRCARLTMNRRICLVILTYAVKGQGKAYSNYVFMISDLKRCLLPINDFHLTTSPGLIDSWYRLDLDFNDVLGQYIV